MKKIKKLGVKSFGRLMGIMYAILGLIFGGLITTFSILGSALFSSGGNGGAVFFGIGAIIFFPLLYGAMGFIFGSFFAWLYNLSAKWIGGIEIEFQDSDNAQKTDPVS